MELKGFTFLTFGLIVLSIILIVMLTFWAVNEIFSLIDTTQTGTKLIASLRKMQGYTYNLLLDDNTDLAYIKWRNAASEFEISLNDFNNSPKLNVLLDDPAIVTKYKAFSILSERAMMSIGIIKEEYAHIIEHLGGEYDKTSVFTRYNYDGTIRGIGLHLREIGNYFSSSYEDTITPLVNSIEDKSLSVQKNVLVIFMILFFTIILLAGIMSLYINYYEHKSKEERMKLEVQMNKFELLEYFAGGLAHDFNNYFSAILCNIGLAKESTAEDSELMDILNDVEYASEQASGLTNQFMTFAKTDVSKRKVINIGEMLKNNAGFILRGSSIGCEIDIADNLNNVEIDESQISEVINNLFINARQALNEGGIIKIAARNVVFSRRNTLGFKSGKYVHISITDNGHGIPENIQKEIFDPFFTTKKTGSGLGLAICYSIIQKNNGYINFESKENAGTTFHIYLHATSKACIEEFSNEHILQRGSGRILILDDDEKILSTLSRMLKVLGYSSDSVVKGEEAVQKYAAALQENNAYSLAILDYTVPFGMGGKDTIKELLQIDPGVKAILSSGYEPDSIMPDYRERGFCGYLKKAYTLKELSDVVASCLSK